MIALQYLRGVCAMVPHLPLQLFLQGNDFLIMQNPLVLDYLIVSDHKAGLHPSCETHKYRIRVLKTFKLPSKLLLESSELIL